MKKIAFLIILSLVALWPFLKKGYFESHDGEWMVIRFSAFHQTLKSGQFPVRFVDRLNNNYGYPVLNFLYPLPFYLAEIPKLVGFGLVNSIKIVFVVSTVLSTITMYWALRQLFKDLEAFSGAVLYLFAPYRFVDLYVRGSLGESVAFAFLPLLFGSIIKVGKGDKKFLPMIAISSGLLILSHNVIAFLFIPVFLIISFLLQKNVPQIIFGFILGFLLSCFFWIPAILDLQYVRLSQIKVSEIADHLATIKDLIVPNWGYGPTPGGLDSLSVQVGLVTIIVFLCALFIRFKYKISDLLFDYFLFLILAVFLLMTKFSLPLWSVIPLGDIIQFPWRMLSLTVFITAFLAAFLISRLKTKILGVILITAAATISTITYTKPSKFVDRGDSYYSTNEDTTTVRDEYLPKWIQAKPENRAFEKIQITQGSGDIQSYIRPANYKAQITSPDDISVQINTIFFPGWTVTSDGQKIPVAYQNIFGLINFKLPQGSHEVIIKYTKTPIHLISELISTGSMVLIGVLFYTRWRKLNS